MTAHRSSPSRPRSGRARAIVSLALLAFVAAGVSVKGTWAAWTDQATMQTGDFTSGTLDITLDGNLVGPGTTNNPGTWTNTSFAIATLSPGESYAVSFPVRNNGTTPLKYTLTGTGSGTLATTANGLQFAVYFGTAANNAATNTGTLAGANRAGTCGTTSPTDAQTTSVTTTATFATDRAMAVGTVETVCFVARLLSTAPNGLQGQTGSASFLFNARQLTA